MKITKNDINVGFKFKSSNDTYEVIDSYDEHEHFVIIKNTIHNKSNAFKFRIVDIINGIDSGI
jgi:hypothetical protein